MNWSTSYDYETKVATVHTPDGTFNVASVADAVGIVNAYNKAIAREKWTVVLCHGDEYDVSTPQKSIHCAIHKHQSSKQLAEAIVNAHNKL